MVTNQEQEQYAGFGEEDLGQGGIFESVLTVKSAKFTHGEYEGSKNFQLAVTYTMENGNDSEWNYSVSRDGAAWEASPDGLSAKPIDPSRKISKTSNAGIWLKAMGDAGFPASQLTNRLDCFFGVSFKAQNLIPSGTNGEGGERKGQLVPALVIMDGDEIVATTAPAKAATPTPPTPSKPAGKRATPPAPASTASNGNGTAIEDAMASALKLGDSFNLPQVMTQALADYADDDVRRDAAATAALQLGDVLVGAGYQVNGYNVTR